MDVVCSSCRTASATAGIDLTEGERHELRAELELLRDQLCAPHLGEYPRISWQESRRQAAVRVEEWGQNALGRLLAVLGGAT